MSVCCWQADRARRTQATGGHTGTGQQDGETARRPTVAAGQFHNLALKSDGTVAVWGDNTWGQRLVIAGAKAQYKGSGTINGSSGDYGFMLTAIDGQRNGGGGVDKFRIKIWNKSTGEIVYDNHVGGHTGDNASPNTALGGSSIVIHKP